MPTLRSNLQSLAISFADSVLAAIRAANLEELLGEAGEGQAVLLVRPPPATRSPASPGASHGAPPSRSPRRSTGWSRS